MKSLLFFVLLIEVFSVYAQNCSQVWGQCGGNGWSGAKCCASGSTCNKLNDWYSQCVPGSSGSSGNNNKPAVTTTNKPVVTTTKVITPTNNGQNQQKPSNIPSLPPLTNLNNVKDPAANCDISDSIRGDSLAKSAPFRFGVGLYGTSVQSSTTSSRKMMDIIAYQFNSVTYTNLMKVDNMLDKSACQANSRKGVDLPVLKFNTIVDGLDFCKKRGLHMRGHTLVWHAQTPAWFFRTGFNDNGALVSSSVMEKRMESYIKQMLEFTNYYYPGVVDVWDVVNEAVEIVQGSYDNSRGWYTRTKSGNQDNLWYKVMGPDYVVKAFRYARKYAAPGTKLIYNDYNTFMSQKTTGITNLLNILKKENVVDGVGLQSYLGHSWPNLKDYKAAIQKFSSLGLEIQITELTISTDGITSNKWQAQANKYGEVFKIYKDLVRSGVKIGSVTVFGLQDNYLFYNDDKTDTRFWDRNLKKKPVYSSVINALKA